MSEIAIVEALPRPPVASDRTRLLLEGPILQTLIRLAAPTVALMSLQAIVHSVEGYYVGFLGAEALAGISLSFPFVMLMTTMSAGAYGGGVSSAVARALGSGHRDEAGRICGTSIFLATLIGAATSAVMMLFGRQIFSLLGATGGALEAAVSYSNIFFLGAIPFWQFQAVASCLRGSGNTNYPAVVGTLGGLITLVLSPPLIFGAAGVPGMGLVGAAWAVVFYNLASAVLMFAALRSPTASFRTSGRDLWPDWHLSKTILRVAIPSAANTLQSNLTFLALTALVAPFGTAALAGYGMSGRLEYLLIPIVFGIGSALIPLVGTNLAAGQTERAREATRAALVLGGSVGAAIGGFAAGFPASWISLFSNESSVMQVGQSYLAIVAPFYFAFASGLILFFAAQGTGRVLPSLVAGFSRLMVSAVGGYLVTRQLDYGLSALFVCMAVGLLSYGSIMLVVARKQL